MALAVSLFCSHCSLCVCARACVSIFPLPGFSHTLPLKPISTFFKKPEGCLNLSKGLEGRCTCVPAKSLQSCLTLWDPMDCSPGSSIHGIILKRILEWVVVPSSRASSRPSNPTHIFYVFCIGRWVLCH